MARPSQFDDEGSESQLRSAFPKPTPAVKRLMIVYSILFAASVLFYTVSPGNFLSTLHALALDPQRWSTQAPWIPIWQLATYGFLHDVGNAWHIVSNLLVLYFFGSMLEREFGGSRFLLLYFASQLVGGLFFLIIELALGQPRYVIGASGACFGAMIAAAALWPRARVIMMVVPVSLRTMALIFVGIEVYSFLMTLHSIDDDPVAHSVHLGGALYGFVAARTGLVRWDPVRSLAQRRVQRAVASAEDDEKRMDQLLEKIHREGMASLSRGEREFLKRVSSRR